MRLILFRFRHWLRCLRRWVLRCSLAVCRSLGFTLVRLEDVREWHLAMSGLVAYVESSGALNSPPYHRCRRRLAAHADQVWTSFVKASNPVPEEELRWVTK